MLEHLPALAVWESFYVILGSAAAALTGLQFVVVVLGAEKSALKPATVSAFGTPTIVHFCAVLLLSALVTAPWPTLPLAAEGFGFCGVAGCSYVVMITWRAMRQKDYTPDLEDCLLHFLAPAVAYGAILLAAFMLDSHPRRALFIVGGAAVLLLFTGIHNAWDAVVYVAATPQKKRK